MINLSKRMQALAEMVSPCHTFCDVGTDHGFLPIYLVQSHRCDTAIAMDLRKGPLERAVEHIRSYQLSDCIETRLSDGVEKLAVKEANTVLIAGMGGQVTIHILTEGLEVCKQLDELILQPQSEIEAVRSFVFSQGFTLLAEDMVEEDGKYYPMMKLRYTGAKSPSYLEAELLYGPMLLAERHPVLQEFLKKDLQREEKILSNLPPLEEERIQQRRETVEAKIALLQHLIGE